MRLLVLCVLAAGCGGGTGGGDDGHTFSDAASSSDAPSPQQGVTVSWFADPALPGTVKTDLTVTSVKFHVDRLQVIGDNGQPMTQLPFELSWSSSEGANPPSQAFSTAPAGMYSQVNLDIDEPVLGTCYEIYGTAKVGGVIEPFHIHDRNSLDVDVKDFAVTLSPGGQATLVVKLDLEEALDSVDYGMLAVDNGYRDLDTNDPQMDDFRSELKDAFKKGP